MKITVPKIVWGLRAVFNKPFYGEMKMPSYIGKPLYIEGKKSIYIGKRVRIFPHIRLESHDGGEIHIENNVYIGQNCHITSAKKPLIIGAGTDIMANVCITNIDHKYEDINKSVLEQGINVRETVIGKNCFIGHGAVIQAGVHMGNHVIVGANSVVNRGGYRTIVSLLGRQHV